MALRVRTNPSSTKHGRNCRSLRCTHLARETRLAVTGAREVHRALSAPEEQFIGSYEIASRVVPARFVPGDFVCSFRECGKTILILGDLIGKGLSAAMWLTHTVDLVRRSAEESCNVAELLRKLNLEILNSRVRVPLTSAIVFSINPEGLVSCASAGHPPALVVRRDTRIEQTHAGGPILGAFSGAEYSMEDISLEKGDLLIAYSDGLIEASDNYREEFTLDRIIDVATSEAGSSPNRIIDALLEASMAFAGDNPLDDISVLALKRG